MPKNAAAISRNSAKSALSGLLDLLRLGQSDGVARTSKVPRIGVRAGDKV